MTKGHVRGWLINCAAEPQNRRTVKLFLLVPGPYLKPVFSEHNQRAIMHNLNIVAFEEFIKFRTFRSGIKDYPFWPKGKNIIKDLTLVVGGEIHDHGMHTGDPGLGVDNRDILDHTGPLAYGNYFMIIANQPSNGLI
jgi:hypothetical protein